MAGKWKFTVKRQIWLAEYVKDGKFNATAAARIAFPDSQNPNKMGAKMASDEMMQEKIKEKIDEIIGPREKALAANVDFWVKTRDDESVKMTDRIKASEDLAKYHDMFKGADINANISVTIQDDIK